MLGLIAPQYGQDTPELHQQRRARTCSQKVTHLTRADAKARAVKLSRQKRVKLKPYKCPTCGFFHLTKAENLKR